jgi:hypothetical protein
VEHLIRLSLATPNIPCFLLLYDTANELFLSAVRSKAKRTRLEVQSLARSRRVG